MKKKIESLKGALISIEYDLNVLVGEVRFIRKGIVYLDLERSGAIIPIKLKSIKNIGFPEQTTFDEKSESDLEFDDSGEILFYAQ